MGSNELETCSCFYELWFSRWTILVFMHGENVHYACKEEHSVSCLLNMLFIFVLYLTFSFKFYPSATSHVDETCLTYKIKSLISIMSLFNIDVPV